MTEPTPCCVRSGKIRNGEHTAPRPPQHVDFLKLQRLDQVFQLVRPGIGNPQFGTVLNVRLAAAQLIAAYNRAAGLICQAVQHLKIVVRRARPAVQE